jgi:hypothetical protein
MHLRQAIGGAIQGVYEVFVIKLVTRGREGVFRTTPKHIRRSMAGGRWMRGLVP